MLGEFREHTLGNALERIEHAVTVYGHGLEAGEAFGVELLLEFIERNDIIQVALVVLNDKRDVFDLEIDQAVRLEKQINNLTGVVCNGLFAQKPADILLIGTADGVETRLRS